MEASIQSILVPTNCHSSLQYKNIVVDPLAVHLDYWRFESLSSNRRFRDAAQQHLAPVLQYKLLTFSLFWFHFFLSGLIDWWLIDPQQFFGPYFPRIGRLQWFHWGVSYRLEIQNFPYRLLSRLLIKLLEIIQTHSLYTHRKTL